VSVVAKIILTSSKVRAGDRTSFADADQKYISQLQPTPTTTSFSTRHKTYTMASPLTSSSSSCLRASIRNQISYSQKRHASLLKRPHRPYTFTQLIALSDGSTYTVRSTSPAPVHRSTQDSRNHPIWQPSIDSLKNVEKDEAGRLRAFRERFGRGWDAEADEEIEDGGSEGRKAEERKGKEKKVVKEEDEGGDSLFDLISGAAGGKKSG